MTMRRIVMLLICLLAVSVHAEDRVLNEDGTFWRSLPAAQRIYFVMGYAHGYMAGSSDMRSRVVFLPSTSVKSAHEVGGLSLTDSPGEITFNTLVDGVNKCYEDFRNRRLDVETCLDWTVRGVNGESDESRESFLVGMRKAVSSEGN
jgi:hypothetical protein